MASKKKRRVVKKTAPKKTGVFRSLTGHNYVSQETGKEVRVEPGDKIPAGSMSETGVKHELAAGNIEKWATRKTENVKDDDDTGDVEGVTVRHHGDDLEMKEV